VELSGTSYTVIGVAPAWFRFPSAEFQLWAPLGSSIATRRSSARTVPSDLRRGSAASGRVSRVQQAQAEAESVSARLGREFPATNEGVTFSVQPLYDRLVGDAKPALTILFGMVALLLLIACANTRT
jgi:hypothetical protein